MEYNELSRWGLLLGILAEMSDIERQLVVQVAQPGTFIPDELLDRWHSVFQGGRGLAKAGITDVVLALLLNFDTQLDELIDHLPSNADDKIAYIRHDEVWRAVREMADWTLSQIAQMLMPGQPAWSLN